MPEMILEFYVKEQTLVQKATNQIPRKGSENYLGLKFNFINGWKNIDTIIPLIYHQDKNEINFAEISTLNINLDNFEVPAEYLKNNYFLVYLQGYGVNEQGEEISVATNTVKIFLADTGERALEEFTGTAATEFYNSVSGAIESVQSTTENAIEAIQAAAEDALRTQKGFIVPVFGEREDKVISQKSISNLFNYDTMLVSPKWTVERGYLDNSGIFHPEGTTYTTDYIEYIPSGKIIFEKQGNLISNFYNVAVFYDNNKDRIEALADQQEDLGYICSENQSCAFVRINFLGGVYIPFEEGTEDPNSQYLYYTSGQKDELGRYFPIQEVKNLKPEYLPELDCVSNERFEQLETQVNANAGNIENLNSLLSTTNGKVDTLRGDLGNLSSQQATLADQVKELQDQLSEIPEGGTNNNIYIQPEEPDIAVPDNSLWIDEDEEVAQIYIQSQEPVAQDGTLWIDESESSGNESGNNLTLLQKIETLTQQVEVLTNQVQSLQSEIQVLKNE